MDRSLQNCENDAVVFTRDCKAKSKRGIRIMKTMHDAWGWQNSPARNSNVSNFTYCDMTTTGSACVLN